MPGPNIDLILMPTFECNMACDYCYVTQKRAGVMEASTARNAIEQCMRYNDGRRPTDIYWHGAEPLLAGLDYFRDICEWTMHTYGLDAVHHHIQTNGTLLNEEWFDLFINYHITTGVSLDGPAELNDQHRRFPSGQGSFEIVFHKIMEARKKKLFFDVLCVITRDSLDRLDEIFDFFLSNRIDFGFEPVLIDGDINGLSGITPKEYAEATTHLFDRWFFQKEQVLKKVVPPYHFAQSILSGVNSYCNFSTCCTQRYLAISPDGDVHSCIMFAGRSEFCFGNINRQPLNEILCSPVRKLNMEIRAEQIQECQKCKWVSLCNSGCPHHALVKHGQIMAPDLFCESYHRIFEHVQKTLFDQMNSALPQQVSQSQ